MRGTPEFPMDFGSKKIITVLQKYDKFMKELEYFDLMTDENITKEILKYSNFPTVPQLYVDGKLIGG